MYKENCETDTVARHDTIDSSKVKEQEKINGNLAKGIYWDMSFMQ